MSLRLNKQATRERDRLFVNDERTVLVRLWSNGTVEVATREAPHNTWGPPIYLEEELEADLSENPAYGPGNPDWEHDREREA